MDKLIVTAACDSSVSYPSNTHCPAPIRENTKAIAAEYTRCIDTGAAIAHLHGVRKLEPELQADGRKLSRIDLEGWAEITEAIRSERDSIVQFGIAGARFEDRMPLLDLAPEMMSVAFNAHDEHFQPDPALPESVNYNVSVMSPTEQWKLLSMVIGLGGHVRVGFEDNPYLTAGELAEENSRLVDKIVRIARELGREIATTDEARRIIGLGTG